MQSESHRGFFAAAFVSAESRAARVKARVKSNTHQTIRRSKRRRRGGGQTHRHRQTQTHVPQITPTSEKIQNAIDVLTKNKTTIVIAHRLSTILNSNKIYVIDSGNVIADGKHEELLEKSSVYKNFYEKQIQK